VVYFAFQVERIFSPENNSEEATYHVINYQDEITEEIHFEPGSGSL